MTLDYESLRLIHWAILVFSLICFSIFEGRNLGISLLIPLLPNSDHNQLITKIITPTSLVELSWVYLLMVLLFAAWPIAFAVLLSSLPWLLLLMVLAWIIRLFSLIVINQLPDKFVYQCLSISAYLLVAFLGIIIGNLLKGIPFHLDSDMRIISLGDFTGLFNPFAILVSLCTLALFLLFGLGYLQSKADNQLKLAYQPLIIKSTCVFLGTFVLLGLWLLHLEGYHINSQILTNIDSNPLSKFVKRNEGLWLDNYEHLPLLWALPTMVVIAGTATAILSKYQYALLALTSGIVTVVSSVLTLAASIFPFLVVSNRSLNSSLTLWDASASFNTLNILLLPMLILLPVMALANYWLSFCHTDKID